MADRDDPIKKALEEGKFDNLPGKGKPLNLDDNPYADPEWRMAHHVLQNGGFTLPWIELRQEIEAETEAARNDLRLAWERLGPVIRDLGQAAPSNSHGAQAAAEWRRAVARFEGRVAAINRKIRDYNLQTPNLQFQIMGIDLQREVARIQS